MIRTPVVSSNLESVGYDPNSAILEIKFRRGNVYQYISVPESVFRGLMQASSKGEYFRAFIRDKYAFRRR